MNTNKLDPDSQLESIRSMLVHGHRSMQLEAHSLPLWGSGLGLLTAFVHDLSQPFYQMDFIWGRVFQFGAIASVILAIVWLDFRLTRRARVLRDESLSPVQHKLTGIIWMIFGFGLVLDIYANLYLGGGRQMFGVYLMLCGMVLAVIGLFSIPWYLWSGAVVVLVGMVVMFVLDPSNLTRLLTASVFIVGGFAIGFLRKFATSHKQCLLLSALWLGVSTILTVAALQLDYRYDIQPNTTHVMQWHEFQQQAPQGPVIVSLPAGTEVPLKIGVAGDVFNSKAEASLSLVTSAKIELEFKQGKPTGIYRVGQGPWLEREDAMYTRSFTRQQIITEAEGPILLRALDLGTQKRFGGLVKD